MPTPRPVSVRRFLTHSLGTIAPAGLTALSLACTTLAADIHVSLSVEPGPLALNAVAIPAPMGPTALREDLRRFRLTITDARGNGAGWELTARPVDAPAPVTVRSIKVRCGAGSTCSLPYRGTGPPTLTPGREATLVRARRGEGMGRIVVIVTIADGGSGDGAPLAFALESL